MKNDRWLWVGTIGGVLNSVRTRHVGKDGTYQLTKACINNTEVSCFGALGEVLIGMEDTPCEALCAVKESDGYINITLLHVTFFESSELEGEK